MTVWCATAQRAFLTGTQYADSHIKNNNNMPNQSIKSLTKRIDAIEKKIEEITNAISKYKPIHPEMNEQLKRLKEYTFTDEFLEFCSMRPVSGSK